MIIQVKPQLPPKPILKVMQKTNKELVEMDGMFGRPVDMCEVVVAAARERKTESGDCWEEKQSGEEQTEENDSGTRGYEIKFKYKFRFKSAKISNSCHRINIFCSNL